MVVKVIVQVFVAHSTSLNELLWGICLHVVAFPLK